MYHVHMETNTATAARCTWGTTGSCTAAPTRLVVKTYRTADGHTLRDTRTMCPDHVRQSWDLSPETAATTAALGITITIQTQDLP